MSRFSAVALLLCLGQTANSQELDVYFGLLHSHTSFSDGLGEPDDAFEMAKDAGLDFMAITEHNHSQDAGDDGVALTPELYGRLIGSPRDRTVPEEFVAIWGQEVSSITRGNHVNVFFADEICDVANGDFKTLHEEWLPSHPESRSSNLIILTPGKISGPARRRVSGTTINGNAPSLLYCAYPLTVHFVGMLP